MSRSVPTINTARLTLRAMRAEDFPRYADIWATPAVVTHITGKPKPKAESWDAFLRNAGHWQIVGFGQWAIQSRGTREMEGQVGFFFGSRGFGDDFDPFPEAGWALAPEAQGTGLGLSMIYGFAKQTGGQVRIYSEFGEGTTGRQVVLIKTSECDAAHTHDVL